MFNFIVQGFKDNELVIWSRAKRFEQAKKIKVSPYCDRVEINPLNERARRQIERVQGARK